MMSLKSVWLHWIRRTLGGKGKELTGFLRELDKEKLNRKVIFADIKGVEL